MVSQKHQLSYTLSALDNGDGSGLGDTLINYRYQALMEGPGRPAFSPRASLVRADGRRAATPRPGSPGLQVNLPFSKQTSDWYWHWNGGFTWLPRADSLDPAPNADTRVDLMSPFLAASGIYRVRPMFNLMLESVLRFDAARRRDGHEPRNRVHLSPGFRGGWNIGEQQTHRRRRRSHHLGRRRYRAGLLLYLSYELPFKKVPSK